MANGSSMPPMLRLKRSAQSGTKAMTAGWSVVYTENTISGALAYMFAGAEIDLSSMQLGDTIGIRVRKVIVPGGSLIVHDATSYNDAQTIPAIHIGPIPDIYGIEISMQQTAGPLRSVDTEFYDAKRLGIS